MRERIIKFVGLLLVVVAAGSGGGYITYNFLESKVDESGKKLEQTTQTTGVVKCSNDMKLDETGISTSVGKIYDAVVTIQNYQSGRLTSSGSGFVYKKEGEYAYILTNHHVVEDATKLLITLSSDDQIEGETLGSDPYLDLAVVRVSSEKVSLVATLGKSEDSNVGDTVFTVGTPIGYEYRGSVTKGTLSGKNRMVTVSINSNSDWIMNVLQVDAAINPGNSGGPLLNANGEVIGINSLKLVEDKIEGMGFAIPIEYAMKYVDDLEAGKELERPFVGITMLNVTDSYRVYQYGIRLDPEIEEGVVVTGVSTGSGAEKAGIKKGDVIISVNGDSVSNAAYLKYLLYQHEVGDTIEITYIRDQKQKTVEVTLTKLED